MMALTGTGWWSRGLPERLAGHRTAKLGMVLLLGLFAAVYLGPLVWPYDPEALEHAVALQGPSWSHPLGTDQYGRDQLARLLDGGRRSLEATALVLLLSLALGLLVGVCAGVAGGLVDALAMRAVDVILSIPGMVLTLALVGALGPGLTNLMIALVVTTWPPYARLARGVVMGGRTRLDVVSARLAGVGWLRAATTHLLPVATLQVLVVVTIDIGHTIIVIAGMSFLGLGVQPPAAEWGAMLASSRLHLAQAPWLLAPAVAISLVVLAANLVGEALGDSADPRRR
ncbi:ABC transporter permease [Natronosporangium hydrolyticum]|uniref:ABC transporter permease n=1 Tax=Natronosporangium hydrolyticum TaxID=2811111 RepID=A0A895YQ00_9ACTN|nr:ABC transporter permease [Natronosporangium hydrolyticum]QSB16816.1 ABC transporter permease [Natronosporangium hydrolyticum]